MVHELLHTSAPRGLFPGSSGFCVVAATRGLPVALMEKLEELSTYRPLATPGAAASPVIYSHLIVTVTGRPYHVLSRIAPAGLDYSGRGNRFAHHVVLEPGDLPAAGPAWLLSQPGFMETTWDGQVRFLASGRRVPAGDVSPRPCTLWQKTTGDAGWAGLLVENVETTPGKPIYLLFEPGQLLLPLLAEAVALLPPEKRWQATFSTYFTGLVGGGGCCWRGLPRGSAEAGNARRIPGAMVLELRPGEKVGNGLFAAYARTGVRPRHTDYAVSSLIPSLSTVDPSARDASATPGPPPVVAKWQNILSPDSTTPPELEVATALGHRKRTQRHEQLARWTPWLLGWVVGVAMTVGIILVLVWFGKLQMQLRNDEVAALDAQAQQLKDQVAQAKIDLQKTIVERQMSEDLAHLLEQSSNLVHSGHRYIELQLKGVQNAQNDRPPKRPAKPHPVAAPAPARHDSPAIEQKLQRFYAALDGLGLGPQLREAVQSYFRRGDAEAFEKKWDDWYLPQVDAEHKAKPQGRKGLEKALKAQIDAEKRYDQSGNGNEALDREGLRKSTRNLLDRCVDNIHKYRNTVAARMVATSPLVARVCNKLIEEHRQIEGIVDEQKKRAAIEGSRYYNANRLQATADVNAAYQILEWLKNHDNLVNAKSTPSSPNASPKDKTGN